MTRIFPSWIALGWTWKNTVRRLLILLWRHCSVHVIILYITLRIMSSLDLIFHWSPLVYDHQWIPSEAKNQFFLIRKRFESHESWMTIRVDTQHRTGKKEGENGPHLKTPFISKIWLCKTPLYSQYLGPWGRLPWKLRW